MYIRLVGLLINVNIYEWLYDDVIKKFGGVSGEVFKKVVLGFWIKCNGIKKFMGYMIMEVVVLIIYSLCFK